MRNFKSLRRFTGRVRDRDAVQRQYARLAREYDSRWSFYIEATTEATIQRLPPSLGSVLDVGCGTGLLLACLADAFPDSRLAGVDASPDMLELARERLPADVTLKTGWAEELPFGDDSFDTVLSCNMFHYIRRPEVAVGEMLRVLRPGGRLIITDWCDDYLSCKLCDIYLRWFDPSHFRMYGASQCHQLLASANAREIRIDKYKISWLWGLMTATSRKSPDALAFRDRPPLDQATSTEQGHRRGIPRPRIEGGRDAEGGGMDQAGSRRVDMFDCGLRFVLRSAGNRLANRLR